MPNAIQISGGTPAQGEVSIAGSKNSSMPILVATMLSPGPVTIKNVPSINDVHTLIRGMKQLGSQLSCTKSEGGGMDVIVTSGRPLTYSVKSPEMSTIRGTIFMMGALLASHKQAYIMLPGGCNLGDRKINIHMDILSKMGARLSCQDNGVFAQCEALHGIEYTLPIVSVGATKHILITAAAAQGTTTLHNIAIEPEVEDLILFLQNGGAKIHYKPQDRSISIEGTSSLSFADHTVMPDRIEAGTYAAIAAGTNGTIRAKNCSISLLEGCLEEFEQIGVSIKKDGPNSVIFSRGKALHSTKIETSPFPGFPTDLQPIITPLLCIAKGTSIITENLFNRRFRHTEDLIKMGAQINRISDTQIQLEGRPSLQGSNVEGQDLRGSAALLIAGVIAKGATTLQNTVHLNRGYERIVQNLQACNIQIKEANAA